MATSADRHTRERNDLPVGQPADDGAKTLLDEQTALPAPALRTEVDHYIGYRMAGFPPGLHRGLPSRHMTLIISIGDPIDVVAQTDPGQQPAAYRCVVGGLQASTALIAHPGHQEGVAIQLTPLGCRTLLGLPSRVLWDTSHELDDVVGAAGVELWERLQPTRRWNERFAVCDEVLTRLLADRQPSGVGNELRHCWNTLVRSGGQVTVHDLARATGYSRQHLRRLFRDEFGLSPKLAARVIRFDRARHMLQSIPPHITLAQVAATCGYYDQAHLNRDFVHLTGSTPTQALADITDPSAITTTVTGR